MNFEEIFMLRCIELAQKGIGKVAPNPMVGATLVYNNKIIGEGWHEQYGHAHAEVNCLNSVAGDDRNLIPESRLYVSLEPCSHFGKTPPCCDLIIREQIPEVVVGCIDSYSEVSGSGIQRLKKAGVQVKVGILEKECRDLNKRFFTRQEKKRPFIILKWAETADGFIGKGNRHEAFHISGWAETRIVHKMRFEEDAVLVGYQTALNDNPRLNNRLWKGGEQPKRVVIDFENSLPDDLHLKDNQQETIIFNYNREALEGKTVWKRLSPEMPLIPQIITGLNHINSLIVEGGAKTLQAFIDSGYWDEIHLWRNEHKTLGLGLAAPRLKHAKLIDEWELGGDRRLLFVPDGK